MISLFLLLPLLPIIVMVIIIIVMVVIVPFSFAFLSVPQDGPRAVNGPPAPRLPCWPFPSR